MLFVYFGYLSLPLWLFVSLFIYFKTRIGVKFLVESDVYSIQNSLDPYLLATVLASVT